MSSTESAVRDRLAEVLTRRGTEIADRWVQLQLDRVDPGVQPVPEADLREEGDALVTALAAAMARPVPTTHLLTGHPELHDTVVDMSLRRARSGSVASATSQAVLGLKEALLEAVRHEEFGPEDMFHAALLVNLLLDAAGALSFETYADGREEIIRRQSRQLLEASTPVVRLWRDVLAVPLIGNLDTARSQVVMENLLEAIQRHGARVAIIDITGVPMVDTSVAQHLMQTVKAVRLMGAECVVSGIRPAIAQTIVQLGIDLSGILTRATLADALETAVGLTGQESVQDTVAAAAADGVRSAR
ncbi:STAS domain-containing protein [Streptomyces genisteinicus]|uniref:STAS domain-containing protein n=1 Tax=Streptomyces genisteinicus TaxID=2768068 RepID=A0A7H0HMG4_9ACTN|nr:STAS domain-containing protein [Streptomyces genisteinicus]QNP61730.1 STAS domain-containing protein [Streptomyces genisteinicus]